MGPERVGVQFIDEARIDVVGGRGGNGCVAFRREKFVPRGGPSGGDGGHGGSVMLVGRAGLSTLFHLRHARRYAAERGRHGEGSDKTGRSGRDVSIELPLGTIVRDEESSTLVGEILTDGEEIVVARGGRGGRGNARFKTATRQAPDRAESGREGRERRLHLELKLLADVGLVGLPNAGKSTFVSAVSAARPKIADYPFTTLTPQLGVVALDRLSDPFVVADLPGLISGAAEGAGLGIQFLRHVERCRVLAHLVDLSPGETRVEDDLESIEHELRSFDVGLLGRQRIVVGSKLDIADDDRRERLASLAGEEGLDYHEMSAATGEGVRPLLGALAALLRTGEGV